MHQTKYYYGSVKKSKSSFSCHLQIDKKSITQIQKDPRGKINSNFAYGVLVRRNLMLCIYLFTPQEAGIGR